MPPGLLTSERLRGNSRRAKATRALIFITLLISAASCLAPGLYASTDCDRWIKEYRQGILQRRAAWKLRQAKAHLLQVVHRPKPVTPHRHVRHQMGPLEALRRFQIDCGTLDEPELPPVAVAFPFIPVETPPLENTTIAELTTPELTPLAPNLITPIVTVAVPTPAEVPEPSSILLALSGAVLAAELVRRRRFANAGLRP